MCFIAELDQNSFWKKLVKETPQLRELFAWPEECIQLAKIHTLLEFAIWRTINTIHLQSVLVQWQTARLTS
jgi:hypothetical protein